MSREHIFQRAGIGNGVVAVVLPRGEGRREGHDRSIVGHRGIGYAGARLGDR